MKTMGGNKKELAKSAFEILRQAIESKKGIPLIALCGGRSVSDFYNYIGKQFHEIKGIEKAQFFLLDERISTRYRNAKMIEEKFFNQMIKSGKSKKSNFHKIKGRTGKEISENYSKELLSFSKSLSFDLIVSAAGEDAHIAALAPYHKEISSKKRGYAYFSDSPKFPPERITLLPESIKSSKAALLFFIDEVKKPAYSLFLKSNNPIECPASIIKRIKKNYILTNLRGKI